MLITIQPHESLRSFIERHFYLVPRSPHDGERWEIHLCEGCFFQAVAGLKQERRIQGLFDESGGMPDEDFGLITKDDFFNDRG
ncbi:hypothetical protein [Pseudomonas sp. KU43P]|uniref:hypothetical protein n=1 Tax=Pseudomonas sp. KU43P TaxID=2487887 RepID=UPI002953EA9B|nr:hypothetical protein [Pseudomonas sp. KU43P]